MLETYRGIPHLPDTWLVLTGMALPIALSSLRRPGDLVPRLAAFCLPAALALVLAATLSPTAHGFGQIGQCGTYLTTTGGLTSIQGLLNVLLFVPAAGMLTLAGGRPADGIAAGIGMSAAVEAIQALVPQLGRSCQLHDLIANTLGVFAGVGLAAGLQNLTRGRRLVIARSVAHAAVDALAAPPSRSILIVRGRPSARHRRGQLVARTVPVPKPANGLRQIARAR